MGKKNKNKNKNKNKKISEEERLKILAKYNTKSSSKKTVENNNNNLTEDETKLKTDDNLKGIVLSLLGHVDAGKTSLKDIINKTTIANNEHGNITQKIGSSYIPIKNIIEITKDIKEGRYSVENKMPGFLIVDTPGHQAFHNLRKRGSRLCDIAILVINIKDGRRDKGLQPRTKESIKLLIENKVPFVIAATMLDTIDGWTNTNNYSLEKSFNEQKNFDVINIVKGYLLDLKFELSKEGLDSEFYLDNLKPKKIYSIVPISNKTKEGLADLLSLLVFISQNWMGKRITYRDKINAIIQESKKDDKNGYIIEVILKNGTINKGDNFVVSTKNGPKITTIRNMLADYGDGLKYYDSIKASQSIIIIGPNLQNCYTGTKLHVINKKNSKKDALKLAEKEKNDIFNNMEFNNEGIHIQTETLSDLEAAICMFKNSNLKVFSGEVAMLNRKSFDILESKIDEVIDNEYRVFVYFGNITEDQKQKYEKISEEKNIKFISSPIIYRLLDEYKKYYKECLDSKEIMLTKSGNLVFPCELKIMEENIFMTGGSEDLMFGIKVIRGNLYLGTPIVAINSDNKSISIGNVISIQKDHKDLNDSVSSKDGPVCVRITKNKYIQLGKQFKIKDRLFSSISRKSINILKKYFAPKISKEDIAIIKELKVILNIE